MGKTILDLYLADGYQPRRVSSARGGEWAGPCPFCGGEPGKSDRFSVWPEKSARGKHWWCRQCRKGGDIIQYVMETKGLSYPKACAELGIEPREKKEAPRALAPADAAQKARQSEYIWQPHEWQAPSELWQEQAARLLERCGRQLWGYDGAHVREWLYNSRRLDKENMAAARLGWCPQELHLDRARWGLPEEIDSKTGKPISLWIPEGVVIPCFHGGILYRLRIRRFVSGKKKKYIFIPGGSPRPYYIDTGQKHVLIVESELDAIICAQEAGHLVNVVALGSVSMRPDPELHNTLQRAHTILVALDTGDVSLAGTKEAWGWWAQNYPQAYRCPIVKGKDPTDAAKKGLDLSTWIRAALAGGAERMTA